ncbi:MAG: hypothetical protein MK137_04100 [Rickettsiales bacterium]|nr:hypothetical protein [Rickettsiales bacterium]
MGAAETTVPYNFCGSKIDYPIDIDEAQINFKTTPTRKFPVKKKSEGASFISAYRRLKSFLTWKFPIYKKIRRLKSLATRKFYWYQKADEAYYASAFRRLKSLAKDAHNHQRTLEYYAKEKRASYGHTLRGAEFMIYYLYDIISDYGRSVKRPLLALIGITVACSLLYHYTIGKEGAYLSSLNLSLGYAIPFYSASKDAKNETIKTLTLKQEAGTNTITQFPDWFHFISISQGLISAVLIFLIALALRNIYRS